MRPKPRYSHSVHDCHTYAVTHPHRTSASLPFRPDTERGYNVRDTENDLDVVFSNLVQRRAGGLVISADTFFSSQSAQLAALALRHAVPTVSPYREFVTVLAA